MVSIAGPQSNDSGNFCAGLSESDAARVLAAQAFVAPVYFSHNVVTGENALAFSEGVAATLASLKTDADTRIESGEGLHVIRMPEHYGELSPLLHVVPLQLLAYHTACARGTDVDKPRNLAKSVTVE